MSKIFWVIPSKGEEGDAGWEHGLPPGISKEQWPRHSYSGLPLVHGFTIRIPEEYRVKGAARVALSYFHPGDSESFGWPEELSDRVAAVLDGEDLADDEASDPFFQALKAHGESTHPATIYYQDILEHDHAIMWHTEDELSRPRCPRPETSLPEGLEGEAVGLDAPVEAARGLKFTSEEPDTIYIQLGWPPHPVQNTPEELEEMGFGEAVLEVETDVGNANYGDGNCQIDLENDLLDWACT